MVKLIATDMDGTLLNDKKEMPEQIFDIIDQLREKEMMFVVASGRQYQSLLRLYEGIKDKITIIAENGGIVIEEGEIVFSNIVEMEHVREIVTTVNQVPGLKIVICGLKSAYLFEDNIETEYPKEMVDSYFPVRKIIKDLDDLPEGEAVVKFAIFDPQHCATENIYPHLSHLKAKYHIAVSGKEWVDIMNHGINKGIAIQKLQEKWRITPKETMVFGDESNDYEMMQRAYYSYAMANAVPKIKDVANFMAPSNEEAGVIQILTKFLAMIK
ncbi:MAG: Cof-type HAD-IIB family hydrolase [Defluviitaleaceae bacterium]|nr:Cof-type HAD-IIB family hydrolase [Defluviitaleaceae bacterium]